MGRIINADNVMNAKLAKELDMRREKSQNWLNPISMSRLQKAVAEDATEIVLEGIRYSITYGHTINFPASGEVRECIKLQRTDGQFVPFGYVSLKKIKEFDFAKGE